MDAGTPARGHRGHTDRRHVSHLSSCTASRYKPRASSAQASTAPCRVCRSRLCVFDSRQGRTANDRGHGTRERARGPCVRLRSNRRPTGRAPSARSASVTPGVNARQHARLSSAPRGVSGTAGGGAELLDPRSPGHGAGTQSGGGDPGLCCGYVGRGATARLPGSEQRKPRDSGALGTPRERAEGRLEPRHTPLPTDLGTTALGASASPSAHTHCCSSCHSARRPCRSTRTGARPRRQPAAGSGPCSGTGEAPYPIHALWWEERTGLSPRPPGSEDVLASLLWGCGNERPQGLPWRARL